jgi:hypothetical protein
VRESRPDGTPCSDGHSTVASVSTGHVFYFSQFGTHWGDGDLPTNACERVGGGVRGLTSRVPEQSRCQKFLFTMTVNCVICTALNARLDGDGVAVAGPCGVDTTKIPVIATDRSVF